MSQATVIKLLEKKKKWMSNKEIAKTLRISCANASLRKLYSQGEVLRREIRVKGNYLLYQYKIK